MTIRLLVVPLFLIASTADAQQAHPSGFPIGRLFTLVSIDGQAAGTAASMQSVFCYNRRQSARDGLIFAGKQPTIRTS
jgi:hypothetical protein